MVSLRVFLIVSSSVFLKQFGFKFYMLPISERKVYSLECDVGTGAEILVHD